MVGDTQSDESIIKRAKEYIELESGKQFCSDMRALLEKGNMAALREATGRELEFGTGGLRGVVGGGFNRMNSYVVARATQGIAQYVRAFRKKHEMAGRARAIIAYDSRLHSRMFAEVTAETFAANSCDVYLFPECRPTPMLAYTLRKLECDIGVVVTASHNPPEYNGYKVYWSDGAQIISPQDKEIIATIQGVSGRPKRMAMKEGIEKKRIHMLGKEHDDAYVGYVRDIVQFPEVFESLKNLKEAKDDTAPATEDGSADGKKKKGKKAIPPFKAVYTPLHGTGGVIMERVCRDLGVECLQVPEQRKPDGNFPTVDFPNPEVPEALSLGLKLAEKEGAAVVVASDPDADRMGLAIRHGGKYILLTGNQTGALLIDYVLSARRRMDSLPVRPAVIKTIVTSELQRRIAEQYGATCYDTLTGFKNIAAKLRQIQHEWRVGEVKTRDTSADNGGRHKPSTCILGGEESFGYMVNPQVPDKDGIAAAVLAIEMVLYNHLRGCTMQERLEEIFTTHGYFREESVSKVFPGASGMAKMDGIMDNLRNNPPEMISTIAVHQIKDYLLGQVVDCGTGLSKRMQGFPQSNVLQFILADGSTLSVRPSGTEPKIKFYFSCSYTPNAPIAQGKRMTDSMAKMAVEQINEWLK